MAKFSVNGTEVVRDPGDIDWARLKNKPTLLAGINGTTRSETVGAGNISTISFHAEVDEIGRVRLLRRTTLTNCDCDCDCGCLAPGTLVLMGDGTLKAVEHIGVGEVVQGISRKNTVIKTPPVCLADQALITLDGSVYFSAIHPMWVKRGDQQWWWVANPDGWRHCVDRDGLGLLDNDSIWTSDGKPELFAHVDGWRETTPRIAISAGERPDLRIYNFVTDGDHTMIANGWVSTAGTNERAVDYRSLRWTERIGALRWPSYPSTAPKSWATMA